MQQAVQKNFNKEEEINSLREDINSLRVTLVGIDGKNGLRSQIHDIYKEIGKMKSSTKDILDLLTDLKIQQKQCPFIYSTKEENGILRKEVLKELKALSQRHENEEKEKEEKENRESHFMETMKYNRYSVLVAVLALIASSAINLFIIFYKG